MNTKEFKSSAEAKAFAEENNLVGFEPRIWRCGASSIHGILVLSYCLAKPVHIQGLNSILYLEYVRE